MQVEVNIYLNSIPLSSIDPDKKIMPMDIFPTNIIKSINVNKSYSSESYGDVSGGSINIKTKICRALQINREWHIIFTLKFKTLI